MRNKLIATVLHVQFFSPLCSLDPECKAARKGMETLANSLSEGPGIQEKEAVGMEDKEAILTPFQAHIAVG